MKLYDTLSRNGWSSTENVHKSTNGNTMMEMGKSESFSDIVVLRMH